MKLLTVRHHATVLALLTFLLSPAMAYAAPLAVTEGGTDFPETGFPNVGTLDVGLNTVSGQVSGSLSFGVPAGDFLDTFSVTLPAGLRIVAGQLELSGISDGGGEAVPEILGGFTEPLNEAMLINPAVPGGTIDLTLHVPYGVPGALEVTATSPWSMGGINQPPFLSGSMSYTLKYTVAAVVPEPGTFALLALGLGGLVAARRWRSQPGQARRAITATDRVAA